MGKDWYEGCVYDQKWRMNHLYHVLSKEDGVVRFRMNWAQEEFFDGMTNRNNILKARQLGMSTITAIYILDKCLTKNNFKAGIIDKSLEDAEEKLGKIRLAYEYMLHPREGLANEFVEDPYDRQMIAEWARKMALREALKIVKEKETDIQKSKAVFANGSEIRIGTSLRGGTLNLLHVSEYGYVANNDPVKASEIKRGGINTVPKNGCVIMESTHEGARSGDNYMMLKAAMENVGKELSPEDYKFFFFPWWRQPEYSLETGKPVEEGYLADYFKSLEDQGITLTDAKKRWYISKEKVNGFAMKTEYPSTPEEAFLAQVEGAIYGSIISRLRVEGKMAAEFEVDDHKPLYVSWDVGLSDYMSMWLVQPGGDGKFYVLDYYCANDKPIPHYMNRCKQWERTYRQLINLHLLPHDMNQREFSTGVARCQVFADAGLPFALVPRTQNVWNGIYAVKDLLPHCVFHKRCSEPIVVDGIEYMSGVDALENYQTGSVGNNGVERKEPIHNACSHGADAFRMFVEAYMAGFVSKEGARRREPELARNLGSGVGAGVPSLLRI